MVNHIFLDKQSPQSLGSKIRLIDYRHSSQRLRESTLPEEADYGFDENKRIIGPRKRQVMEVINAKLRHENSEQFLQTFL